MTTTNITAPAHMVVNPETGVINTHTTYSTDYYNAGTEIRPNGTGFNTGRSWPVVLETMACGGETLELTSLNSRTRYTLRVEQGTYNSERCRVHATVTHTMGIACINHRVTALRNSEDKISVVPGWL
jgi:hypothetical protein